MMTSTGGASNSNEAAGIGKAIASCLSLSNHKKSNHRAKADPLGSSNDPLAKMSGSSHHSRGPFEALRLSSHHRAAAAGGGDLAGGSSHSFMGRLFRACNQYERRAINEEDDDTEVSDDEDSSEGEFAFDDGDDDSDDCFTMMDMPSQLKNNSNGNNLSGGIRQESKSAALRDMPSIAPPTMAFKKQLSLVNLKHSNSNSHNVLHEQSRRMAPKPAPLFSLDDDDVLMVVTALDDMDDDLCDSLHITNCKKVPRMNLVEFCDDINDTLHLAGRRRGDSEKTNRRGGSGGADESNKKQNQ